MQEFVYYSKNSLDFPVSEEILVTSNKDDLKNQDFLVSNTNKVKSEIVADEIEFYIKNTEDSTAKKIENIYKLYNIAANRFDLSQDLSYFQDVKNRVLLVSNDDEAKSFINKIKDDEFDLFRVTEDIIISIDGHIGNLKVLVKGKEKNVLLNVDQIVWFGAKDIALKQSGTQDPLESSIEETIESIRENIGSYEYRKYTTYDANICQYHNRREEICAKCEEVCPTVAIVKFDEDKHLEFSQIDCHGCGGCISVCPSGALDYAPTNRDSIFELSKEYKDVIPLIIPAKMNILNIEVDLKEGVLPFKIEGEKFLHESTFLTILQQSGSQIIFFTDFLSKGSRESIRILNDIYQKKYKKDAILVAMNKEELEKALEEVSLIENSHFFYNQTSEDRKREVFSVRLAKLLGEDDLGIVKTGEHIHYAKVVVNEANCTLCLSCVGACNVDALKANASDNTLRLNPSICTGCGYCELSCPESDCLSIVEDIIELKPSWFKDNILAKADLFACVECGKEFATRQAVEKIASIMEPKFRGDDAKVKSLYCCENCKPKVMFQTELNRRKML